MMSRPNPNSAIVRHLFKYARANNAWKPPLFFHTNRRFASAETEKIVIPKRIPRGPTDILEALASTVRRDPTAPHYKFHDDPFLTPVSNHAKRSYALAQEAGRKAAQWIKQEHADLFQHKVAEPFIEAFAPVEKLTETTPMTEELLKKYINTSQVANAIIVFERLGIEAVGVEAKQSFLELICFYNQEDQLSEDLIEERWFKAGMKGKDQMRNTWKNNGLAEKVFNSMDPKTPEAFCALVSGMAKYGQASGAWDYYNQMLEQGFTPDLTTYNSLLRIAGVIREGAELQVKLIQEIIRNMIRDGIKPDVLTLNAILETTARMPIYRLARETALQTLTEFKTIGVNPSLGSYYYILRSLCREKGPVNNVLVDILNQLEQEMPPLQDTQDGAFFAEAMRLCHTHLENVSLARRLHDLYSQPRNQVFIGDSFKESVYYRNFLQLVCRTETPEVVMELYRQIVPNIYTPEPSVFEAILHSLKECSEAQYVPELWNDAIYMEHANRDTTLELILTALASGPGPSAATPVSPGELDPILATAKSIVTHVDAVLKAAQEKDRPIQLRWTGTMLDNLIKVFLQYGDTQAAFETMAKVMTLRNQLSSFLPIETLNALVDKCIEHANSAVALMAVDYAAETGFTETAGLADRVTERLTLDDRQQQKLKEILRNVPPSNV